ncbi:hypothetical protein MLD38_001325 [Melastoma candidum]|uniref:Uncharacterized protein n=1 Tax=Melastoma candidum TaxID=119954 RepID=A0ACB9SG75_9MYRT|nr:hypothetical protein MLD38_001325 [Melastoma candidum]
MIFSNHIAGFPPPSSSSSASPFILPQDHGHHHHHHDRHDMAMMMRRSMSFDGRVTGHGGPGFLDEGGNEMNIGVLNGDGDLSDDGSQMMLGEKKKRLSVEQVKALERSFETGNKLEPERKAQLARSLGLQPRQVAIWFQNRRARWKTKQLERDYEVLKRQLEILKSDNDALHSQNEKLHAELMAIKAREMNGKRAEGSSYWSNNNGSSDVSCDINLDISRTSSVIDNSLTLKLDPHHNINTSAQDDTGNLCNIFGNGGTAVVDEHRTFWPWAVLTDQHDQLHES